MEATKEGVSNSKRVGFALFGTGRIGTVHFQNLVINSGRVEVRWVVEEDTAKARALLEKYHLQGKVKVASTTEVEAVLGDAGLVDRTFGNVYK